MPSAEQLGVDVLDVVKNVYNIEGSIRHNWFDFLCPVHEDTNPSCGINLEHGGWLCFSCGSKGDIVQLGVKVLQRKSSEVERLIKPGNTEAQFTSVQRKIQALQQSQAVEVTPAICKANLHDPETYWDSPMSYMRSRGITNETSKAWGLRYVREADLQKDEKTFTVTHSIGMPVRDVSQNLLGWIYRATTDSASWQPKVLYTPHLQVANIWFGEHMLDQRNEITIVEGALDAMFLWQCGIPALALLGSQPGNTERLQRLSVFKKINLFLDRDKAGIRGTEHLGERIRLLGSSVYVVRYPKAEGQNDPLEIGDKACKKALGRAMPYNKWRLDGILRRG